MSIKIFLLVSLLIGNFHTKTIEKKRAVQENKQFIYVLRYTPKFKQTIRWTAKELEAAKEHVAHLKNLMDEGKGYFMGRTTNLYDSSLFGIVVFDAPDAQSAMKIMQDDPLIKNNIMEGALNPFQVVFMKQ